MCVCVCVLCTFVVVGEVVVTLLDSEDVEIVYAACGVLLNLMAVPDLRHLLTDSRGVRKCVDVYCSYCMYICMSCNICKAMCVCNIRTYVHTYICTYVRTYYVQS